MATLFMTLETVGEEWESLDGVSRRQLVRSIAALSDTERQVRLAELQAGLALSPLYGSIVSLAVYDTERAEGTVYLSDAVTDDEEWQSGSYHIKPVTETDVLTAWWQGVRSYDTVVTFLGRTFAVPFLVHRSIAHGIAPSVRLLDFRHLGRQARPYHVDLYDQFSFYGTHTKHLSLHGLCRAYGIESPVTEDASGDQVAIWTLAGDADALVSYTTSKIRALTLLYEKFTATLAPSWWSYRNQGESDEDVYYKEQ